MVVTMSIPSLLGRRQQRLHPQLLYRGANQSGFRFKFSSKGAFRTIVISLALIALVPPIFFHFKLKRFQQMKLKKCGWLKAPPLVCAHGGDSTEAFPNTMDAYHSAIHSQVDCIEMDVSRSADGVLFALHDRDLQRISGNATSKVGHLSEKEIQDISSLHQSTAKHENKIIPTVGDALTLVSSSVKKVILDVKVGPPFHEKVLAKDIMSVVEKTQCKNCIIWSKSDNLVRDVIKLSSGATVGYIVMNDPSTGSRTSLLRIKGAEVVGAYHPLIDESLVSIVHRHFHFTTGSCDRRNKKVYAWTVDDKESMYRMLIENVDAVVTSNPTLLQRIMQDTRTQCLEEGFSLLP